MRWSLARWTWRLEAPFYAGSAPAGSLNRCRPYVPARALWGAFTAELAQQQAAAAFPAYEELGKKIHERVRFTYLYPAELDNGRWLAWLPRYEPNEGLVWRREDSGSALRDCGDREFRRTLFDTRPGTAIDPSSDTAAEATLRETECINTFWRRGNATAPSPVALAGYVFLREGDGTLDVRSVTRITVGGDSRYGLGRLRRIDWTSATLVFGRRVWLEGSAPAIESDIVLAHAGASEALLPSMHGQREVLAGWNYGQRGVQRIAESLWTPGSRIAAAHLWVLEPPGFWGAADATPNSGEANR